MIFNVTINLYCLYVCATQILYISLEQSSLISLITYWPPVKPFKVIIGEWAYDCVCVCVCGTSDDVEQSFYENGVTVRVCDMNQKA